MQVQNWIQREVDINDIFFEGIIATGLNSTVYRASYKGQVVAVKRIFVRPEDTAGLDSIRKELNLMGGACHINVHTCYGMCVKDTFAFLLTEYMPLGSLFGVLHDKAMDLTFHRQSAIGIQAAAGLAHLHSFLPPIVHRDV